jgi:hypothetical protein
MPAMQPARRWQRGPAITGVWMKWHGKTRPERPRCFNLRDLTRSSGHQGLTLNTTPWPNVPPNSVVQYRKRSSPGSDQAGARPEFRCAKFSRTVSVPAGIHRPRNGEVFNNNVRASAGYDRGSADEERRLSRRSRRSAGVVHMSRKPITTGHALVRGPASPQSGSYRCWCWRQL